MISTANSSSILTGGSYPASQALSRYIDTPVSVYIEIYVSVRRENASAPVILVKGTAGATSNPSPYTVSIDIISPISVKTESSVSVKTGNSAVISTKGI